MRVALLSHNARTGDAVGQQVAAKAGFFRERGADLHVYVECDRQLQFPLRSYLRLVTPDAPLERIAEELQDFDLLCVEYSQHYRLLEALPLLRGKRPRILLDYHGVTPLEYWNGPREPMRRSQDRRGLVWFADEVVVHSRFMRRELSEAIGFPAERIFELPLFFEVWPSDGPATLRQRLNLGAAKLLLFVGRLAPNKRVPVLIEAVARLKDEWPEIHALIAGDMGDIYHAEFERCRDLAKQLGLSERVHFLGRLSGAELSDVYRSADIFVMPSRHEGFCIPVVEAMSHGLLVVAARAGALPESIGGAGLSFAPDDPADLAAQIRRILRVQPQPPPIIQPRKIAVVAARYGAHVLGGAERSLRLIAEALADTGYAAEVFTTGTRETVEDANGIHVHRFPHDPVDTTVLAASVQALRRGGVIEEVAVRDFLEQTRTSSRLLVALEIRASEFAAILAGPYANGLTWEVARRFPERTLLLPCFHDEPLARQPMLRDVYARTAGLLYHSTEEKALAELELGLNHPNGDIVGTWLADSSGDAGRGRRLVGSDRPYLLYCGRYCHEKNLPLLLDWWKRYRREQPGRFCLVCIGEGQVPIPDDIADLGFLAERDKNDVIAGAQALVQPSVNESLSLTTLEAWGEGVPVIAHASCAVMAGHLQRGGGGATVSSYEQFRDAVNDLHARTEVWRERGGRGRDYVRCHYSSRAEVVRRVEAAVAAAPLPLTELLRRRGRRRAAEFTAERWAERFAERVDSVLHRDVPEPAISVEIRPRSKKPGFVLQMGAARLIAQVRMVGTRPLLPDGPAAAVLQSRVVDRDGAAAGPVAATRLPGLLLPGRAIRLPLHVCGPKQTGDYVLEIAMHENGRDASALQRFPLVVTGAEKVASASGDVDALQTALRDADITAELPAAYVDVSEGFLAAWKQRLKRKLLQQFQTAYVDVLSRQQTAFNRSVLAVLHELAECTAMLERTVVVGDRDPPASSTGLENVTQRLRQRVRAAVARIDELEQRLARLEARLNDPAVEPAEES